MSEAKDRNKEEIRKITQEIVDQYFTSEGREKVAKLEKAVEFLQSEQGRLVISQALHYAIKMMSEAAYYGVVRDGRTNVEDMIYFRDTLFNCTVYDEDEDICLECERFMPEEWGGKCHVCNARDFS